MDKQAGNKKTKTVAPDRLRQRTADDQNVGTALRAAYQQAVDEKVPSEMLDLLSKLN